MKSHKLVVTSQWVMNVFIVFNIIGLILLMGAVLTRGGLIDSLQNLADQTDATLTLSPVLDHLDNRWIVVLAGLQRVVGTYLLFKMKSFLVNLFKDRIFTAANVSLAKHAAGVLAFLAVIKGVLESLLQAQTDQAYLVINLVDGSYLLAAVVVWCFALLLQRAEEIAEENELTI